jgi:tetratricopeptide (TPR) repeat protein
MVFSQGEYFLRLAVFILFLGFTIWLFFKKRQLSFWPGLFLIGLLPMLTPWGISWIVAERYVYFSSLGIFVLAALLFQKAEKNIGPKTVSVVFAVILALLSLRTIARNRDWQNQDSLWLATAKTSPSSAQNHNNLGDLYGRRGELDKAVEHFKKAIELQPNYGDAYHNLANTYGQMGKIELAIENYQKALEFNPGLWQSDQNLAAIYFNQEKFDLAAQHQEKAVTLNPQNASLHYNLAVIYQKLGENEKANQEFQKALEIDPKLKNF